MPEEKSQKRNGFECMTMQDEDDYMLHLAKTDGKDLEGLELDAFEQTKRLTQQQMKIEARLKSIGQEKIQLEVESHKIQGRIDAVTELLMKAEDKRRKEEDTL